MNVRFYLRDANAGTKYIFADFNAKGMSRLRLSTQIQVKKGEWNQKEEKLRGTSKDTIALNKKLSDIKGAATDLYRDHIVEGKQFSREILKLEILRKIAPHKATRLQPIKTEENLLTFTQWFIDNNPERLKQSTIKSYREFKNILIDFINAKGISYLAFENVNFDWKNEFSRFLFDEKNHSINTQCKWIKKVKSLMEYSFGRGKHTNLLYKNFKCTEVESDSIALTEQEVKAINTLKVKPDLQGAKDVFVFNCYSGGLRVSDILEFVKESLNNNRFTYIDKKTGNKHTVPLVLTEARQIIEKYNGELPKMSEQHYNRSLKTIGALVPALHDKEIVRTYKGGIEKVERKPRYEMLSSHTARRTFCTLMAKRGIPFVLIMAISGHKKESSFKKYIKWDEKEKVEDFIKWFEKMPE